jgi:hypothetical protein
MVYIVTYVISHDQSQQVLKIEIFFTTRDKPQNSFHVDRDFIGQINNDIQRQVQLYKNQFINDKPDFKVDLEYCLSTTAKLACYAQGNSNINALLCFLASNTYLHYFNFNRQPLVLTKASKSFSLHYESSPYAEFCLTPFGELAKSISYISFMMIIIISTFSTSKTVLHLGSIIRKKKLQ